jgi:hypothetical protein
MPDNDNLRRIAEALVPMFGFNLMDGICTHYDDCPMNHTTMSSDYFCDHECEKFHPGHDDE